jgi:hypothetical protein
MVSGRRYGTRSSQQPRSAEVSHTLDALKLMATLSSANQTVSGIVFATFVERNRGASDSDPEEELIEMMRPQPIREIAPPVWSLPLISIRPRGPRALA